MAIREELERIEDKLLAPYALKSKQTRGRKFSEKEHPYRTCFQRDRDRIVHSHAFRRLEYKTQVFIIHEGDYFRTRLTHTLEVAQISRTIAQALRLNQDLTEAISLAHDLGHTPFGHAGEEALNEIMEERGGFNHNLQGLRVVDFLEERYPQFRGLNLCWEVREGIIKHTPLRQKQEKLEKEFEFHLRPSLEAQIVIFADEIAYDNHDLDDGLKSGFILESDLDKIELWRKVKREVKEKYRNLPSRLRIHLIIRSLIDLQVSDLISFSQIRFRRLKITTPEDVRNHPDYIINFSPSMRDLRIVLRRFLTENLYRHFKVARMSFKAKLIVRRLFHAFLEDSGQLPPDYKKRLSKEDRFLVIGDYIAGMTDRFAQEEYERLFDPGKKM